MSLKGTRSFMDGRIRSSSSNRLPVVVDFQVALYRMHHAHGMPLIAPFSNLLPVGRSVNRLIHQFMYLYIVIYEYIDTLFVFIHT
jgi:hypothetical protein